MSPGAPRDDRAATGTGPRIQAGAEDQRRSPVALDDIELQPVAEPSLAPRKRVPRSCKWTTVCGVTILVVLLAASLACALYAARCSIGIDDCISSGPIPVIEHPAGNGANTSEIRGRYVLAFDKSTDRAERRALYAALDARNIPYQEVPIISSLLVDLTADDLGWLSSDPRPAEAAVVQCLERDMGYQLGLVGDGSSDGSTPANDSSGIDGPAGTGGANGTADNETSAAAETNGTSGANGTSHPLVRPDSKWEYIWGLVEDFWYQTHWHLDVLDKTPSGSRKDGAYQPHNHGQGVDIYVVDTGVRTSHSEFEDRVAAEHWEARAGTVQTTRDFGRHGTGMAGAALGKTSGSAALARVVSVQAMGGNGDGQMSDVIAGLDWIGGRPCESCVVSMSLGSPKWQPLDNAVQNLVASGFPVVVSAGNNGGDACEQSPASVPEALTVGALDRWGNTADFSNRGRCVDIWAPGEGVMSASPVDMLGDGSDSALRRISGTSPATAIAAGIVAVYLQAGIPKADFKNAMLAGATQWNRHPFVNAHPPSGYKKIQFVPIDLAFAEKRGTVSGRRRWYRPSWFTTTIRSATMDGRRGDTLHCRIRGHCNEAGCDVDLRALGHYGDRWNALGHSRSNTLNEDLRITLLRDGDTACEAFYVDGSATLTVYSSVYS